jgi:hypothetical protein
MMTDKQVADMQAATDAAQAQQSAEPVYAGDAAIDIGEDISMEEVLGPGMHKKPVAAEEVELPKVESQTV